MRTYDGFGYYENSNGIWKGKFELSVPEKYDYDVVCKNISTPTRNGISMSFKIKESSGGDNGDELVNPNLEFETIELNLSDINKKKIDPSISDFQYDRPFYVLTYHDNDPTSYAQNDRNCHDNLLSMDTRSEFIGRPAKSGFGSLKKI